MRFILLDRVTEIVPGERISAVKAVTLAEEYLADHFPRFPVLPGVFMIEALVQTAAMLVRVTNDFAQSIVVLHELRNVKYKSFVKPGHLLDLNLTAKSIGPEESSFVGSGTVDGREVVNARLKLRHFNLVQRSKNLADMDTLIKNEMRTRAQLVGAC
jgi:3-hydroxyacyl-[acyl-carrier-protein] dehydratase